MNTIRALRYFGITLFCGCSVGLLFTFIFMIVLGLNLFCLIYPLTLFSSLTVTGGFAAFVKLEEPTHLE